jgi:hypothetical protein
MEIGTKIVIAAYNEDGDYVDKAEYEVTDGNGGIKPTAADGIGLTITTTGDYTFVAYSLNTTSSFTYSDNRGPYSANNAADDPLWGSTTVTVSAGMNRVNIEMRHVFSKVKIKATSTELSGTPAITNVLATLVGYKAVIQDGAIGKGVAEDQDFAAFPASPTTTALSAPRVVYAGGEDITTIKITSATIGTTTHTGSVAKFNKKLLPGRSYTLTVKFDELVWAGSNIFWDGNRLTFYPAGDTDNQGYQGVFFKFGSLVGISPAQKGGSTDAEKNAIDNSNPIFVPYGYPDDPKWKATTGATVKADVGTASNWTSWGENTAAATDIPYMDPIGYAGSDYGRDNRLVMEEAQNTTAMYQGFKGDICQYLSTKTGVVAGNYRLPTSGEFGLASTASWDASNPNVDGWIKGTASWPSSGNNAAVNADGTANLLISNKNLANAVFGSGINRKMGGVVFPASGFRNCNGGALTNVGFDGIYWSGSANKSTHSYLLSFYSGNVYPSGYNLRSYGYPVRCVRN